MLAIFLALIGCTAELVAESTLDLEQEVARDAFALCAGAGRAEGGGFVVESCTGPADPAVGTATGGGYTWVPGPSEVVSR